MEQPARRKLLKGSLSAPLVLTVASPSALAATSFQACIARVADQPQPSTSLRLVSAPDQWLRVEVSLYEGRLTGGGGLQTYYKAPDNLFYRIDGSNCAAPTQLSSFTGLGPTDLQQKRWALVYIDANGTTVGYGMCPNSGYAVTASCWTSFATAA